MKDIFKMLGMVLIVILVYVYRSSVTDFLYNNILSSGNNNVLSYNEYYKEDNYLFVQNIDKNNVSSYKELINMIYTIINSGDDSFTFKCNYDNCIKDMYALADDTKTVPNINNFVHPYNSFSSINVDINEIGTITIRTKKTYNSEQIDVIDSYIDEFIKNNINDSMDTKEKIKLFHDYIINNTIYDENNTENSYNAYTLIKTGKAICGGYSDIMAIYLDKLGIKNYKITSDTHIWNLVYLDNKWYHLDATWDDPVSNDKNQYLIHNFFLIPTDELLKLDNVEHNYNKEIYLEAN